MKPTANTLKTMEFEIPLTQGKLIKRYKRFLADVELENGDIVVAHCANSGSMMGLNDKGSTVWLSPNQNPKAKFDWRWELASQNETLVGINTSRANAIVADAINMGLIPELSGYASLRREVKYGKNSRIDILLEDDVKPLCYVEVKSVTLRRPDGPVPQAVEFPDAITSRGAKHLDELSHMRADGHRAMMFYLIQRGDCDYFRLASDIDPKYKAAFDKGCKAGVETVCYSCRVTPSKIELDKPIAFIKN